MSKRNPILLIGSAAIVFCSVSTSFGQSVSPELISGLKWRNVGPFRGGRVAAVSGAIGQPGTYYMGMPLGGVWKTTSAGTTWYPIFDDIKSASSVGAVEVAPSDPNVIYVGMGDLVTGGGINEGDGVYKSVDAGKTWKHLGLDSTKQIPSILVDPHNPNLVLLAAQGNIREESEDRGVFRSTDGGSTWTRTLFVDKQIGAQKITWAYDHPETMLATTVRHYNAPGAARGGPNGGGGGAQGAGGNSTKLFISKDEGITWKEISGHGLPGLTGRTSVAIANGTDAKRMFIVGNFGLYRSDDGGGSWKQMDAADRRVANGQGGYNCGVYVNPKNPDIVYVINTSSYRSLDGGKTFTGFKGAPGGDDPQQMWLDPTDGNRLFLGTDQGATVSLDGGLNWSSWYNQPTAQVYHISVDNQYPYWIYATQQDSGCVGTASRGNFGAITPLDWLPHPGYEFGAIVADPLNPKITYAGSSGSGITKTTCPSGQSINVSPNMDSSAGLRHVANQPLAYSPTNPKELLAAFQFLMSTTDGGMHWKKLGPDLGYPKGMEPKPEVPTKPGEKPKTPAVPPVKPPITGQVEMDEDDDEDEDAIFDRQLPTNAGGSIESFSVSSVNSNIIWVGTNNGLIKLTKDHGKTWDDVTIPGLANPRRADMSSIDASHHDLGTAYVAIDYHGVGDLTPHIYRTKDFGKTWTKIVKGMATDQPSGSFARVVKSDTKKAGLLFAGTESSVYVSFNDGDEWQSLTLNAPNTSYRDMVVKDNDLVVGTYGRSFWILDDISPLREISAATASEPARLFKPGDAIRVRRNVNGDTPYPPEVPHALNAPVGAIIYYYLGKEGAKVSLEISDSSGKVVRHMSSNPIPPSTDGPPPVPDFWVEIPKPMPTEKGTNRINWNLRYDNPNAFSHNYEINANPGETPASPEGPLVAPGIYTVKLIVDGQSYSQTVTVKNDPRSPASADDLKRQCEVQAKLYDGAKAAWDGFQQVAKIRALLADIQSTDPVTELSDAVAAFDAKLALIGGSGGGGGRRFGGGFPPAGGAPVAPTFAGTMGNMIRQMGTLEGGDIAPNEVMIKNAKSALADLATAATNWKTINGKELTDFNAILAKYKIKPIASINPG
jgi:photosystem II stability/assembly factor-like uncharacterized protein